ncbi:MAG TPA: hypothetical protein VFH73_01570 [Polyangia bacterium]|jgi:hypothetical protein|nr:hypothetical protein [Polyangia bacterium]
MAIVCGVAAAFCLQSRPVLANGAFPDSLQILLPADQPQQIIFATNFGLMISDDGGMTWSWTCEQMTTSLANLYQVGPPPTDILYAIAPSGLGFSTDGACRWELAGGRIGKSIVTDSFADPTNPNRVLAVGIPREGDNPPYEVYASDDGGRSFGAPIYTAPARGGLLGVEIARSDPKVVYLAMYETLGIQPRLVRSTDGGATWDPPLDVQPMLGSNWYRIVAVDPTNPARIFFRVSEQAGDTLAITEDGGATFTKPVIFKDRMTAFALLASGTILVSGSAEGEPAGFRSTDGGKTFTPWDRVPAVRALAERDGKLFVAGDNFRDGFALAVSTDEGTTMQPLTTFDKVASIRACTQVICEEACDTLAGLKLWPPETCRPDVRDGRSDVAGPRSTRGSGCGCGVADARAVAAGIAAAAALLARRLRAAASARRRPGGPS